ncbi:MAG: AAA family ATPase [Burkholderiaceae bacterium]|nr:AAA family ATPase [Burkholderiaceae bacterium]
MHIDFIEIANFRKLLSVRVDFSKETTLFVGANNSGKTSAVLALRRFLVEKGKRFRTQDFTLSHWSAIDSIGKAWEALPDGHEPAFTIEDWASFLPSLDLWLWVEKNEFNYVSGLLPALEWDGGSLGVRTRLEPENIGNLFRDFRKAIKDVRALHDAAEAAAKWKVAKEGTKQSEAVVDPTEIAKRLNLWPVSLTDFLGRKLGDYFMLRSYILDPSQLAAVEKGLARPQALPPSAMPLASDPLNGLIRINEINAQRGLGESDGADIDGVLSSGKDGHKLSDQLRSYYTKHLDPFSTPEVSDLAALQAIEAAQEAFDQRLHESFTEALTEVEGMGYPGVFDPKLRIASKLKTTDGLDHEAAVSFEIQMVEKSGAKVPLLRLPESYNGLGYQNLISMIFRLMSFRDSWMRVGKAGKVTTDIKLEPLHLVLVEEPEAHLHAQVQQVFINKAYSVLRAHKLLTANPKLKTQLIVSTHSSHVAHETSFSCLRYFRRLPAGMASAVPVSTVVNLSTVFGAGTATERFVTRYLRAQHCDLFFADAAILVEGPAEKMLVPNFIRSSHKFLTQCYVTMLEINGSHSHTLKELIEALGLVTLIITDIDAAEKLGGKGVIPERGKAQKSGNTALRTWCPKEENVDGLLDLATEKKIITIDELFSLRVAYQVPVKITFDKGKTFQEALPSTFEDALAFENLDFFKALAGIGMVAKFREAANSRTSVKDLSSDFFLALESGSKAAFSLDVIWSDKFSDVKCPAYIAEGLSWLEDMLQRKQVDVLPGVALKTGSPA